MIIEWDEKKNAILKKERGLSFEMVLEAIEDGRVMDDYEHNQASYSHQRILIIKLDGYPIMVPYDVQEGDRIFLKTMFHNRKLKGVYDE